jgi:hypothetical protein
VESLLAVAFLGAGASAAGFVTWAYACARVDVSVAAATLYAVPVVAFSVGWVWLGERPAAAALLGGAIALVGVALVAGAGSRRTAAMNGAGPERSRPIGATNVVSITVCGDETTFVGPGPPQSRR